MEEHQTLTIFLSLNLTKTIKYNATWIMFDDFHRNSTFAEVITGEKNMAVSFTISLRINRGYINLNMRGNLKIIKF